MAELKPCPFCGSNNVKLTHGFTPFITEKYKGNIAVVACGECGVNGGIFNLLAEGATPEKVERLAVKSWNRRAINVKINNTKRQKRLFFLR